MNVRIEVIAVKQLKGRYHIKASNDNTLEHIAGGFISQFQKDLWLKKLSYNRQHACYYGVFEINTVINMLPEKGTLGKVKLKLLTYVGTHNTTTKVRRT